MALELNDQNFKKEVLDSATPVLVDFWASWCGPCKAIAPIIEELVTEYKDKPIKIAKLEVDANEAVPAQYQIMSVPTLIIFKHGQPVQQMIGMQTKEDLKAAIDAAIA